MKKATELTSLVGIVAALSVGCGAEKHTLKNSTDDLAQSQSVTGSETQGQTASAKAQAEAPKAQAETPKVPAAAPKAQAAAPKAQAAAPKAQAAAPKAQAAEPKAQAAEPKQRALPPFSKPIPAQQQADLAQQGDIGQQGSTSQQGTIAQLPDTGMTGPMVSDQGRDDRPDISVQDRDVAQKEVKDWFAADGRSGVLSHLEEQFKNSEKNISDMSAEEAAPIKVKLEAKRLEWEELKNIADESAFLEKATNLLSDLFDIDAAAGGLSESLPQA
jgi:hypothetical protein